MRPRRFFEVIRAGAVLASAAAGVWLLVKEDPPQPPARQVSAPPPAPSPARASVASIVPPPAERTAPADEPAPCAAAPVAADTLAALPSSLDAQVVDAQEAESRAFLGRQLVEWLAIEDHAAAALMEADQIGELAPWLAAADLERLLTMARTDALEARRRAAFVALAYWRPASSSHVDSLVDAFSRRPSEEARLGLLEALLMLRQAGADVSGALEVALDARFGAPSPEAQALVATGDRWSIR